MSARVNLLEDLSRAIAGMEAPVRERRGHRDRLIDVRAAVAELIAAGKELIDAQQYYDEIDSPGGHRWDRLCTARARHASALAQFGGAK